MAVLEFLIIHCTATPAGRNVTKQQIIDMHTKPVSEGGRGWKKPGYSDMIHINGELENIVPYDGDDFIDSREYTNGASGYNMKSRHIVYVGGLDGNMNPHDTRTEQQKESLKKYVLEFKQLHPETTVLGHYQIAPKACPCFNVPEFLKEIGL